MLPRITSVFRYRTINVNSKRFNKSLSTRNFNVENNQISNQISNQIMKNNILIDERIELLKSEINRLEQKQLDVKTKLEEETSDTRVLCVIMFVINCLYMSDKKIKH